MRRAAPLLLLLAGCIQADESLTLFPDGSGKLVMKVAFKKSMLKMIEENVRAMGGRAPEGAMPPDLRDPLKLLGETEGFSALRPGPSVEDGDWIRTSITGYFEDINRVRVYDKDKTTGARRTSFTARYVKTADGGRLALTNRLHELRQGYEREAGAGRSPEAVKASLDFMKPMLQDFRLSIRVTVPGPIQESSGFPTREGRTVSTSLDTDLMTTMLGEPTGAEAARLREMASSAEATVAWSGGSASAEVLAAFRAELAEAKSLGVRPPGASVPSKPGSLAADADTMTDDEVERLFIDAQIKLARGHLERGRKDQARETLQGVLKDYPKAKAAQEAKKLLESLK